MSENDFYDIVLDLKSLSNLKEGFPIEYTEKGRKKINEFKNEYFSVITAIGNSKQGKSFILSKISNINISSGHHINTNGLSILFPDNYYLNKNYIIIDTEGTQNEIKIDNEIRNEMKKLTNIEKYKRIKEFFEDKQMTENFLQTFAIYSSNIVIAVISQFTLQEQKFLNRIKSILNRNREIYKNKDLFIIHNLMFLESKKQVENYIKDTIESSIFFKLEKTKIINFINIKNENEKDGKMDYLFIEEIDDDEKKKIILFI